MIHRSWIINPYNQTKIMHDEYGCDIVYYLYNELVYENTVDVVLLDEVDLKVYNYLKILMKFLDDPVELNEYSDKYKIIHFYSRKIIRIIMKDKMNEILENTIF